MSRSALLPQLEELARSAGRVLLETRQNMPRAEHKADGSLVSLADKRSEAVLLAGIKSLAPGEVIFSEESPHQSEATVDTFWFVDPLDGTEPYLEGSDEFSVLVARIENGKPVLGIMYFPALDEMFSAVVGKGAQRNNRQLRCQLVDSLRSQSVGVRRRGDYTWQPPVQAECISPQVLDSGYLQAQVILGKLDAAVLLSYPGWDLAAPALIAREAGCAVVDAGGKALQFQCSDDPFSLVIICPQTVLEETRDLARTLV